MHLVSAWASHERLVLGQEAVEEKSNEITAIPALLDRLAIKGALVTIDAIACNPTIAQHINDAGADYLLAVKDNQPTLLGEMRSYFDTAPAAEVETASGTVVHAFSTGAMVQVFLLAPEVLPKLGADGDSIDRANRSDDDGLRVAPETSLQERFSPSHNSKDRQDGRILDV